MLLSLDPAIVFVLCPTVEFKVVVVDEVNVELVVVDVDDVVEVVVY